jgi:hypothetical protein
MDIPNLIKINKIKYQTRCFLNVAQILKTDNANLLNLLKKGLLMSGQRRTCYKRKHVSLMISQMKDNSSLSYKNSINLLSLKMKLINESNH